MIDPEQTQLYIATPAIWTPGMNDQEWEHEIGQMFNRSQAASDFLAGKLTPEEFEMALDDFGVDPYQAAEDWDSCRSYMQ